MQIPKINNWRFFREIEVVLHWVNSPNMEGTNHQWRTTATFKDIKNRLTLHEVPWGMLPWLKLGQSFQDGQPISKTVGEEINIIVPQGSTSIAQAKNVISKNFYSLQNSDNLNENCIIFKDNDKTIILPIIEAIRAIFAINKSLAYGLLESSYLQRVITQNEVDNQVLRLSFSKDIPQESLTETSVRLIARILYDDSFNKAWHSVYSQRLTKFVNSTNSIIPLIMELPNLSSSWRVRALYSQSTYLILEILEISPKNRLPFNEIQYDHPSYQEIDTTGSISEVDTGQIIPLPTSRILDISEQSPKESKIPRIVDTITSPVMELNPILVTKIKKVTQISDNIVTYKKKPILTDFVETVTLSGKAPNGKFSAAEFEVVSQMATQTHNSLCGEDGFGKFSEAIKHIFSLNSQWQKDIKLCELEKDIPFSYPSNKRRKYAIISIDINENKKCCILEFSRPDNHAISTLIFSISKNVNLEEVISQLINDALIARGSWRKEAFKTITCSGFNWMLAKHSSDTAIDWGTRLLDKVTTLLG